MTQRDASYIGRPELAARGHNCCGKPQGCTNLNPGCAYLGAIDDGESDRI